MPERGNIIATGGQTAQSPDPLLAALPDTSKELAHLALLGRSYGRLDGIDVPQFLASDLSSFTVTADGAGSGGSGSASGTTSIVTNPPGVTPTTGGRTGIPAPGGLQPADDLTPGNVS